MSPTISRICSSFFQRYSIFISLWLLVFSLFISVGFAEEQPINPTPTPYVLVPGTYELVSFNLQDAQLPPEITLSGDISQRKIKRLELPVFYSGALMNGIDKLQIGFQITIMPDGSITNLKMIQASGNQHWDDLMQGRFPASVFWALPVSDPQTQQTGNILFNFDLAKMQKKEPTPIPKEGPIFLLYHFAQDLSGKDINGPLAYQHFVENLRNKARLEEKIDSRGSTTNIPSHLVPDFITPNVKQTIWAFISKNDETVCRAQKDKVTGYYLDDGVETEFCFNNEIKLHSNNPSSDLFAILPPNINPTGENLSQVTLTPDQITAILKQAAWGYKIDKNTSDPDKLFKIFASDYKIPISFSLNQTSIQVVQLEKEGEHVLCLIRVGDVLIIQDHYELQKLVSINHKLYFLFGSGDGYSASESVFELNGITLKKVSSASIATD